MRNQRLCTVAAALWWGSLGTIGFYAVPTLFAHLQPAALAGNTAARLFSGQTWISVVCAMLLLVASRGREHQRGDEQAAAPGPPMGWIALVLAGMLLALLSEFAIAPRIVARENLKLWHGLGTAAYALQWVCAGLAFWRLLAPAQRGPA